ncbi:sensor c-di-GMP phosphodiesterase-like protein [Angulomicrobium tetraedrale]|uniref:cyclic-guanylate-specific phosphodiesterase n=1 Tax=Ancylobacter tetraedralis TaxID=217068 RepID=A0A839Z7V5_9HYPH|nr:sensor c-di-GMP phosphodiesterase-like protein [Ancylobacter tetraedralis]
MRRWRVVVEAMLIVAAGMLLPLAIAFFLSWRVSINAQQDRVDLLASEAVAQALSVFADARATLHAATETDLPPCSPQHIALLRELMANSLATDNIGYVDNNLVRCTAWGPMTRPVQGAPVHAWLPDGIGLSVNFPGNTLRRWPLMVIKLGKHSVVVAQVRFVLQPTDPDARVEVTAPNGIALATTQRTTGNADIKPPPARAGDLVASREAEGWKVTVRLPRPSFSQQLNATKYLLLSVTIPLAVLFGGIAFWLMRRRLSPRGELELAVRQHEFVVHYQPIIELATSRCIGAEALVRWRRPDGTLVGPDLFIPLAEYTGFIEPITDQVLEAVVADLGDLLRNDRRQHISINVGAADISSGRILAALDDKLARTGIEPQQIWVEATERGFVDIEGARVTLAELHRRGHMTAIDDFGTGYSSLQYLQRLPVDALKIDKSFIEAVGTDAPTRHVTDHIIAMARELMLQIIAEGVETEAQAAYLRRQQVGFAQGWLFSPALPAQEYIAFCRANRAAHGVPEVPPAFTIA